MPDSTSDTRPNDPVAPMPPGFENLPDEDKLFLFSNRDNPQMLAIYNATKTVQLHRKHDKFCTDCETRHEKVDSRINSLETSRSRFKWVGGTVLTIFGLIKTYIIGKLTKVLP